VADTKHSCAKCGEPAPSMRGSSWYCDKHRRLYQMRRSSRARGKTCPTAEEIERLVPKGMVCPDCQKVMVWNAIENQKQVATIQHYRDGTFGIVCRSCNTRHAWTTGDLYREHGPDNKWCSCCKEIKPLSEYYSTEGSKKTHSRNMVSCYCKPCSRVKAINSQRMRKNARESIPE